MPSFCNSAAMVSHGVRTYGHPGAAKIGHQPFLRGHGQQRRIVRFYGRIQKIGRRTFRIAPGLFALLQQGTRMARRAFDLPERFAAMHAGLGLLSPPRVTRIVRRLDKIQRPDFRQRRQFGFLQARHAQLQIVDGTKRPQSALAHNFPRHVFTQSFDVTHSQTQGEALAVFFEMAGPVRNRSRRWAELSGRAAARL